MRITRFRAAFALAAAVACFCPGSKVSAQASKGLPPIIDRELFFGDPEIESARISPDGKFIAFLKPFKGTRNVWVKRTEEPFEKARPITADATRPIPGYFWSRDGKYVLFIQDKAGDENFWFTQSIRLPLQRRARTFPRRET